jgi:acetyl esterase
VYGVAPATIITAEHDFLRGEAEEYAERLRTAGVPVELTEYAGQIHGFFEMFSVMTDAQRAVDVAGDAVRRAFRSIQPSKEFSCDR